MSRGPSHQGGAVRLARMLELLEHLRGEATVHQLHLRTGVAHGAIDRLLQVEGVELEVVEPVGERQGVPVDERRWRLRRRAS